MGSVVRREESGRWRGGLFDHCASVEGCWGREGTGDKNQEKKLEHSLRGRSPGVQPQRGHCLLSDLGPARVAVLPQPVLTSRVVGKVWRIQQPGLLCARMTPGQWLRPQEGSWVLPGVELVASACQAPGRLRSAGGRWVGAGRPQVGGPPW